LSGSECRCFLFFIILKARNFINHITPLLKTYEQSFKIKGQSNLSPALFYYCHFILIQ